MKKLTISIVIPAYNEESRIERCLYSIESQSVKPDEIIVVDNNSTDKTAEIVKKFPKVKLICEKKQGIVFARNKGFEMAKSDIIGRIDADSVLPQDWISSILGHFNTSPLPITGPGYFYNLPFKKLVMTITDVFGFRVTKYLSGNNILWGSNMAILKKDWQKIKNKICNRKDIHEDLDLAAHLEKIGIPTEYDQNLIVGAEMKTGLTKARSTWNYLLMRPRTHRVHRSGKWVISYLCALFIFSLYWIMPLSLWVINGLQRHLFAFDRSNH